MNYVNPPEKTPQYITHKTFFSQTLNHEIGYCIYLPPGYAAGDKRFPAVYHIHGWQGNESSEIWSLEKAYAGRQAITVFANAVSDKSEYRDALLQIETVVVRELIPYVEGRYRTYENRESRTLSGFSMGGAMAFYYAVKHCAMFGAVIPYAATFHHQYHKGYRGVNEPREKAAGLYNSMLAENRHLEGDNILCLVSQNADKIRGVLNIDMRIGADDILICDNDIMHMYLNSLDIPHSYGVFPGAGHELHIICG